MSKGRYGIHGGQYVPETLMNEIINLENAYEHYKNDPEFVQELDTLLREYAKKLDMQVFLAFQRVIHKGGNYGIKKETGYRNEGHFTEGNGNP